ncbi:MAG: DUF126 domain-containing protein [Candidatus Rokubacteria bacterium]|nr:DUF126 domain-containing protein [Candidatus Rokubacteria bacterium]
MRRLLLGGRRIMGGRARGPALVTTQPFMFAHGIEPATGLINFEKHELRGRSIAGTVMALPFGVGSSSGAVWFLEAVRQGTHPVALVVDRVDPLIATAVLLARRLYDVVIPCVERPGATETLAAGRFASLEVDGDEGNVYSVG